jgi:hypothetical protein
MVHSLSNVFDLFRLCAAFGSTGLPSLAGGTALNLTKPPLFVLRVSSLRLECGLHWIQEGNSAFRYGESATISWWSGVRLERSRPVFRWTGISAYSTVRETRNGPHRVTLERNSMLVTSSSGLGLRNVAW